MSNNDPVQVLRDQKSILLNEYQANKMDLKHHTDAAEKLQKRQGEIELAVCQYREAIDKIEAEDRVSH